MAQSKFTLYKYIKLARRLLALLQGYIFIPRKNQAQPLLRRGQGRGTSEGGYYLYHKKNWIPVGADAWKHNAGGMPGLTMMSSNGCKERFDPDPNHRADHAKAHACRRRGRMAQRDRGKQEAQDLSRL